MPLEIGGRADKMCNRYEIRCIIYEMLKVLFRWQAFISFL